jgi:hypothetical protein
MLTYGRSAISAKNPANTAARRLLSAAPMSSRETGVCARRMDPRDGIALWRVVREQRGTFAGPFSFMMLAQRYWPTSAVLEQNDEVVGYLLARRDDDTLRILDCEIGPRTADGLWELLQIAIDPRDEVAYVDLPCAIDHRLRRAHDGPLRPAQGPRLAKASPLDPSAERLLGRDGRGACSRALA